MLRDFISVPSAGTVLIPLLVLLCTMFGPGLLNIAPAPYIGLALTLGYLDRLGPWSWASVLPNIYLILCIMVGTGIAYSGMLQHEAWDNSLLAAPFLIGLGIAIIEVIPFWVHLAWQRRFLPQERFQNGAWALLATLVAPAIWVALFTIVYAVSPIGSYGSVAYTQMQIEPIVQWASVAGIAGIEFLVVWGAVIIHRCWTRYVRYETYTEEDSKQWSRIGASTSTTSSGLQGSSWASTMRLSRRLLFSPTPTCLFVFAFVYIYGSMRFWNGTGSFFMRPLRDTIVPTVKASCVIGASEFNDMPTYLNQTVSLAKEGSEIVLWSESLVEMKDAQMKEAFWGTARNISTTYGIYLGVTYSEFLDAEMIESKNMFTLFGPQGQILFEYQKANPVAMVETTVEAGPQILPVVETEKLGRVGGSICFDMDFPNFIAQAGTKRVDLMLQPSWTWGSIGRLEAYMQSYRVVEQGFTLFRCGSWAPSTVYDPYRQLYGYKNNLGSGTFTVDIPLQKHVQTIYSAVGNLWQYICCAFAVVTLLLVLIPKRFVDRWIDQVENRLWRRVGTHSADSNIGGSSRDGSSHV